MSKRILCFILAMLMAFTVVGCNGCDSNEETQSVAETTPVETETQKEVLGGSFEVFGVSLSEATADELPALVTSIVEEYVVNVNLDETEFEVPSGAIGMAINPELKLDTIYEGLKAGTMTTADIEKQLFTIGDLETAKEGLLACYETRLQQMVAESNAAKEKAEEEAKAAKEAEEAAETTAAEATTDVATAEETAVILSDEELKEIENKINGLVDATSAKIKYSDGRFIGVDGTAGQAKNYDLAAQAVLDAAATMSRELITVTSEIKYSEGEKAEGNSAITKALEKANAYFNVNVTYNFACPNGKSGAFTINSSNVIDYIYVASNGRDININTDSLSSKVSNLIDTYSSVVTTKDIQGETVTTTRKGWTTDFNTVYNNFKSCIANKTTGNFTAAYYEVDETTTSQLRGETYVEVDLDAQQVMLYKNGVCIMTCSCVSGCVKEKHWTSRGTYTIYSKERSRYLSGRNSDGSTYRSYVDYWMPFCGGQGLHDADWRSDFGGDIYLWGGSHGCVNLPKWAAKLMYETVSVGTKVIVYGGLRTMPAQGQTVYCNDTFNVETTSPSFNLGASADGGVRMLYESLTPSVITVDGNGNVTIVGAGSGQIKITAVANAEHTGATKIVTVNVSYPKTNPNWSGSSSMSIDVGESRSAGVSSDSSGAMSYSSLDSGIASVSSSGSITGVSEGSTTITVYVDGDSTHFSSSFTITVTVNDVPETSPTETSPTETSPTETSPTETSPTETSPTETSPTETSPTQESVETQGEPS